MSLNKTTSAYTARVWDSVARQHVDIRVELTADLAAVAQKLGEKAAFSTRGKSTAMEGALVCKVLK